MSDSMHQAERIDLARYWWLPVLVLTFLIGGGGYGIWAITWPAVKAARLGQPLPAGWTWASVIGVDMVLIGLFGYLCWQALIQWLTYFTIEGIGQPRLGGYAFLRWSEVTRVTRKLNTIELQSSGQTLQIAYAQFRDIDQLITLIRERVPARAFQSDF